MTEIKVNPTAGYFREVKILRKKYRHIQDDIDPIVAALQRGETPGVRLQGMGDGMIYKARVASRDMQKGKSGSMRLLYYFYSETEVLVLFVYVKNEKEDLPNSFIRRLVKEARAEFEADVSDDSPTDE